MRILLGEGFTEEREAYAFRFCCEACAYFLEEGGRCAHGWPNDDHRAARYTGGSPPFVDYCKEFELW